MDTITDTTLTITLMLHRSTTQHSSEEFTVPSQGMEKFKGNKNGNNASSGQLNTLGRINGTFEVDVLVAPCPAILYAKILYERMHLCLIRGNVKSFLRHNSALHRQSLDTSLSLRNSISYTSASETLSLAKTVFKVNELLFVIFVT